MGPAPALLVSFVALAFLWREPRLTPSDGVLLPGWLAAVLDSRWLRVVAQVLAVALTLWTLLALVFGPDYASNPVPHVVYVWLWVGLRVPVAGARRDLGVLNPLRWLHPGVLRLARVSPDLAPLLPLGATGPRRWASCAFTWVELVAEDEHLASVSAPARRVGFFASRSSGH